MRLPSPLTRLTGQTYHTASGVQLAIRDAAEILTATPIVLAAVPHWPKGIQEDLQAIKGGRGHQLFSVGRTEGGGRSPGCMFLPGQPDHVSISLTKTQDQPDSEP